jgi:hypothetical protein
MAVGLPAKTTFATGDIFLASDINDTNGTINLIGQTTNFYAGKNRIINGDFGIWQRGTSFTPASGSTTYTADRFLTYRDGTGATVTVSRQNFTAGAAPVTGYESQYFYRYAQTVAGTGGLDITVLEQRIEDVRTFANQTVQVSFWAKADAARGISVSAVQSFNGSADVYNSLANVTLTTSWVRYTGTATTLQSISGKTIGANNYLAIRFTANNVNIVQTIDIWGLQVEAGTAATAFQTATSTKQGELAACQRYYYRNSPGAVSETFGLIMAASTTASTLVGSFPVTMRTAPSALDQSGTAGNYAVLYGTTTTACSAVPAISAATTDTNYAVSLTVASGLTLGRVGQLLSDATTGASAYLGWSAEL